MLDSKEIQKSTNVPSYVKNKGNGIKPFCLLFKAYGQPYCTAAAKVYCFFCVVIP
jgi:hypothetical protein